MSLKWFNGNEGVRFAALEAGGALAEVEIDPTWRIAARIWWAACWRGLIALGFGTLAAAVFGAIAGSAGAPQGLVRMAAVPVAAVIGLGLSVIPVRAILGKDFGAFRLVLVAKEEAGPLSTLLSLRSAPPNQAPLL